VLDVTGWSTSDGGAIDQWTKGNGQGNQEWSLKPTGDGYYYIQNRNSGKVLDVTGYSTSDGTTIEQWDLGNGQANQEWSLGAV
jgi:Ricin-type beta-trefoil lectin domain-like